MIPLSLPFRLLEEGDEESLNGNRSLTIADAVDNDVAVIFSANDATVSTTREQAIAIARLFAAAPDLADALEATAEALDAARGRLWIAGEGDGSDRRADAPDDFGILPALKAAREALTKAGVK